jgi:hypothetical protein
LAPLEARYRAAAGDPKALRTLRHVVAIERWGQRRLRVALGDAPFERDESGAYAPPDDAPYERVLDELRVRAETVALARRVAAEDKAGGRRRAQRMGPLTAAGWLRYLRLPRRPRSRCGSGRADAEPGRDLVEQPVERARPRRRASAGRRGTRSAGASRSAASPARWPPRPTPGSPRRARPAPGLGVADRLPGRRRRRHARDQAATSSSQPASSMAATRRPPGRRARRRSAARRRSGARSAAAGAGTPTAAGRWRAAPRGPAAPGAGSLRPLGVGGGGGAQLGEQRRRAPLGELGLERGAQRRVGGRRRGQPALQRVDVEAGAAHHQRPRAARQRRGDRVLGRRGPGGDVHRPSGGTGRPGGGARGRARPRSAWRCRRRSRGRPAARRRSPPRGRDPPAAPPGAARPPSCRWPWARPGRGSTGGVGRHGATVPRATRTSGRWGAPAAATAAADRC